jgi:hypothetical protein
VELKLHPYISLNKKERGCNLGWVEGGVGTKPKVIGHTLFGKVF